MSSPVNVPVQEADSTYAVKEAPVCVDNGMKEHSMTTEELQAMAFDPVVVVSPLPVAPKPHSSATTVVTDVSSESFNTKVLKRKESRQGRSTQRWGDDRARLVTGCVPILRDGRVLLVSASRKLAWILLKGGWEQDEPMEESAVRETFEEAGCVGTLGAALSPVKYETRKSKQQRASEGPNQSFSEDGSEDPKPKKPRREAGNPEYSHVQMTLFCLYIRQIKQDWPEPGRLRRAVPIDEAIELVRPEFQVVLREIKDKGLHHLPPPCDEDDNKADGLAEE